MEIAKQYVSVVAEHLIKTNELAAQAFQEVRSSILNNVTPGSNHFILNCTRKNCNGVVPVKERCYQILEEEFGWYREKPLTYFHEDAQKGGPIDVYKEFTTACGQKTKNKHAEIIFHGTDDLDSTTTKKIDLNRKNRQRNQFS